MKIGQVYRLAEHTWTTIFDCRCADAAPIKKQKHSTTGTMVTCVDYGQFIVASDVLSSRLATPLRKVSITSKDFQIFEVFAVLDFMKVYSHCDAPQADRWLVKMVFEDGRVGWVPFSRNDLGNFEKV